MKKLYSSLCLVLAAIFSSVHLRARTNLIEKELSPLLTAQNEYFFHLLDSDEKERFSFQRNTNEEFIVRSANAIVNSLGFVEEIFSVAAPGHHAEVILFRDFCIGNPGEDEREGFLTNKGRFVFREEAFKIAKKANQIKHWDVGGLDPELFSEALWSLADERGDFMKLYSKHWSLKLEIFFRNQYSTHHSS